MGVGDVLGRLWKDRLQAETFLSKHFWYIAYSCLRIKEYRSPWLQSVVEISFLIVNKILFFYIVLYSF